MKVADVRDLSDDQIQEKLVELKREHFNMRFQRATGQLENTTRFRQIRRDVARLKTIARERKLKSEVEAPAAGE